MSQLDCIFVNGQVLTAPQPATALAISGPWIVYTGDDGGARSLASPKTRLVDLVGKTVVPGFIDAHTHMVDQGLFQLHVDLYHAASRQEALARVARRVGQTAPGEWVLGYRWLENEWENQSYFSRQELDAIAPDQPVLLTRLDGHLGCVNSAALARLPDSADLRGVLRGPDGAPNGALVEDALGSIQKLIQLSPAQREEAILAGVQEANRLGVTSIHDMVVDAELSRAYQALVDRGELKVRVYLNFAAGLLENLERAGLVTGFPGRPRTGDSPGWLRLGAIKIFADGAVGPHTAAVQPGAYVNAPDEMGLLIYEAEELAELVCQTHQAGFQLAIHTIGDRALDVVLDALAAALKAHPRPDHRHRIEHAEMASREHAGRLAQLQLIASMQPNFVVENWSEYAGRLGEARAVTTNPLGWMVEAGVPLALGSDVMPLDPLFGLHCAVNRAESAQRLTPAQALHGYTWGGAFAAFEETVKGLLAPGYLADIAVLSHNPLTDPAALEESRVLLTMVNGQVVYDTGLW
jgi:predicted amidohydrolase YtcJ